MTEAVESRGKLYAPGEVHKIVLWVDLLADIIASDTADADRLLFAVDRLGGRAQAQYPELQFGGSARLEVPDAAGSLDRLPLEVGEAFVFLTGDVLFAGIDGPAASARLLDPIIRELEASIRTEPKGTN